MPDTLPASDREDLRSVDEDAKMARAGTETVIPTYSIGAVARMLNVPTSTLRAWEARYRLITPLRSSGLQRLYSGAQLEHLRLIKAQIEAGLRASDAYRVVAGDIMNRNPIGGEDAMGDAGIGNRVDETR